VSPATLAEVNDVNEGEALFTAGGVTVSGFAPAAVVNYAGLGQGGVGDFGGDSRFPNGVDDTEDFALQAVGRLTFNTAGSYVLRVNSDDGFRLRTGVTAAGNYLDGTVLSEFVAPRGPGNTDTGALVQAAGSTRDVGLVFFERGGGDEVELSYSLNGGAFQLVGAGPDITVTPVPVPEPAAASLAGLGHAGLLVRRRRGGLRRVLGTATSGTVAVRRPRHRTRGAGAGVSRGGPWRLPDGGPTTGARGLCPKGGGRQGGGGAAVRGAGRTRLGASRTATADLRRLERGLAADRRRDIGTPTCGRRRDRTDRRRGRARRGAAGTGEVTAARPPRRRLIEEAVRPAVGPQSHVVHDPPGPAHRHRLPEHRPVHVPGPADRDRALRRVDLPVERGRAADRDRSGGAPPFHGFGTMNSLRFPGTLPLVVVPAVMPNVPWR